MKKFYMDQTVTLKPTGRKQLVMESHEKEEEKVMKELNTKDFHGHPRFYEILQEMADLHSHKNHDYAGDDPLSNLRASEEIGIPAWKGILIRLIDKWARLKTFAKTGTFEVKDESVRDTLMDNAIYSILCIIILEETEKGKAEDPNPYWEAYDRARDAHAKEMKEAEEDLEEKI